MGGTREEVLKHDVEFWSNFLDLDPENDRSRSKCQSGRRDSIFFLNDSL